jgi:hypothetical protein
MKLQACMWMNMWQFQMTDSKEKGPTMHTKPLL